MENIHSWMETAGVLVTALATIALAWVTAVLARETKRLAAIGQQPQVIATIEPSPRAMRWFDIHLENTGTATAFDILLEFSPELQLGNGKAVPLKRLALLKPSQTISSSLTDYNHLPESDVEVTASWSREPNGKSRESLSYTFSMKHFEGMHRLGKIPIIEMAESLRKISESFEKISWGHQKLEVNIHSSADRAKEQAELDAYWAEEERRAKAAGVTKEVKDS